ncbi:MAG: hypothetical protein WDN10_03950 [bacterium]
MNKIYLAIMAVISLSGIALAFSPEAVFESASRVDPGGTLSFANFSFWTCVCIGGVVFFFSRRGSQGKEIARIGLLLGAAAACLALMSLTHYFAYWHQGLATMLGIIFFVSPLLGIAIALSDRQQTSVPNGG